MFRFQIYDSSGDYLESQRWWIFSILMTVGGFLGAFTYTIRGGVFCNAQTANFVLFAMALGDAQWSRALYFLIPMSAYFLGALLSEAAMSSPRWTMPVRWETVLVLVEMVLVVILGLLPESAPYQISQVVINFMCSMQYNTFRIAQGVPMATTFCTNHLRQTGIACCKAIRTRDIQHVKRLACHLEMLAVFVAGAWSPPFCAGILWDGPSGLPCSLLRWYWRICCTQILRESRRRLRSPDAAVH